VLSDVNASDFVGLVDVPLFVDTSAGRDSWKLMEPKAVKHDTFVFSRAHERVLFWDVRTRDLGRWEAEIGDAVRALGK
jgi:hypothetical protein